MTDTGSTDTQSPPPSGPLPDSDSSSGVSTSALIAGTRSAQVLSWAAFATITYAWLWTDHLSRAPWWGPVAALVLVAMPGGVVLGIGRAAVGGLLERLPIGRSGKP